MKCIGWILAFVFVTVPLLGCGGSPEGPAPPKTSISSSSDSDDNSTPTDVTESTPKVSLPSPLAASEPANRVVETFLESLRGGDESTASALLTDKAREETAKQGMKVQPPGSPNATYSVSEPDLSEENGAYVNSTWTETDSESGASESFEIVWVLRRQSQGWRIAGMAAELVPGQEPMLLNFEDPEDMLKKLQEADQELTRQVEQAETETKSARRTTKKSQETEAK